VLKPGLKYFPPPSRGADPLSLDHDDFLSLIKNSDQGNIDIKRWLGRTLSISKKFIELAVQNSKLPNKKVRDMTSVEIKNLFEELTSLIRNISTGIGHEPCIILDDENNPADVSPMTPSDVPLDHIRKYGLYADAIDEFLNYSVLHASSSRNSELAKQIESLEHDLNEQKKAKDLVIPNQTSSGNLPICLCKRLTVC
jgi:predicted ribosome quality control (RQC) complex YloA/Tae2 family protein